MPFIKINMWDDRFLYRCPDCGAETPDNPVRDHELGPPPQHLCPKSNPEPRFDMTEILSDQKPGRVEHP
jgi:hypothetical protein